MQGDIARSPGRATPPSTFLSTLARRRQAAGARIGWMLKCTVTCCGLFWVLFLLYVGYTVRKGRQPQSYMQKVQQYRPTGNCSGESVQGVSSSPAPLLRGEFLSSKGLYEVDDHPLSSMLEYKDRLWVMGWVYSPGPECLPTRIASIVGSTGRHLILIHTTLDSDHFSLLLNLLLSLRRVDVDTTDILVVLYNYRPIPDTVQAVLAKGGIQYISVWEFDVPDELLVEPKLTAPQFFFVRTVVHLKLLKMGYHILNMDSDLVVLQEHPFKGLHPEHFSIEAAPGASPHLQRSNWGHTLNCGYMSLASTYPTIRFLEDFLAYNFDSKDPIDQWALNQVLDKSGIKFQTRRSVSGKLVPFKQDRGPITGFVDMHGSRLHLRILDPTQYIAGRWLNQFDIAHLTFKSFIDVMGLSPRSVHITNVQKGVAFKIESLKHKGLWFVRDNWETVALGDKIQDLSSFDNGIPSLQEFQL